MTRLPASIVVLAITLGTVLVAPWTVTAASAPPASRNGAFRLLLAQLEETTRRCRADYGHLLGLYRRYLHDPGSAGDLATWGDATYGECHVAAIDLDVTFDAGDVSGDRQIQPHLPRPLRRYLTVARLVHDVATMARDDGVVGLNCALDAEESSHARQQAIRRDMQGAQMAFADSTAILARLRHLWRY